MSVALIAPGRAMLLAPGRGGVALWQPLRGTSSGGGSTGGTPASITGLSGWWDAGAIGSILGTSGSTIPAFGSSVGSLADKSGVGSPLTVYHAAPSGTVAPIATPRVNGLLGGLGLNMVVPPTVPASGQQLPAMDPDQGLLLASAQMGSGEAWTRFLVWTRPNWRQKSTAASPLLTSGATVVLAADNSAGHGDLTLFPGTAPTILTNGLTRRHSHAVILRNTPGSGVDVWLDGTQVASAATNPLTSSTNAPLLFLHGGGANGGAECWFHEAATWEHALVSGDIATLVAYAARWTLGVRRGVQVLVTGQSNAGNGLGDGAWHLLAQGIAWHLGAAAYGVVGSYSNPPAGTMVGGAGIYPAPLAGLAGSFLTNPGTGANPDTWALGADGNAVQTWLDTPADTATQDLADICAIMWPWSETDSVRLYSEKATFEGAAGQFMALERGMLSRTAESLPLLWWSAIPFPYGNDVGMQMHREVVAEIAAASWQNVTIVLPQTADSLPRSPTSWNPLTGVWVGGDTSHRDVTDNQRFGRAGSALAARAVLAASGGDTLSAIPSGLPSTGGPVITHAYLSSTTTVKVTVAHDCGTDLIVPTTLAATGAGWGVMDGGSMAAPGRVVTATACTYVDATHLEITLSAALNNPAASCTLFYPYGATDIGRGDAVTDNYASVTKPTAWDISADLGSIWSQYGPAGNWPIQAPVTVVAGVATSGIALSAMP